jgi:hypothetical protein
MRRFDAATHIRYDAFAGWSSLVARRAHNPKVVGSNPTPATIRMRQSKNWRVRASSKKIPRPFRNVVPLSSVPCRYHSDLAQMFLELYFRLGRIVVQKRPQVGNALVDELAKVAGSSVEIELVVRRWAMALSSVSRTAICCTSVSSGPPWAMASAKRCIWPSSCSFRRRNPARSLDLLV